MPNRLSQTPHTAQNLQQICLLHGQDTAHYKILFQTIENAVAILERDDEAFFLLFIEDVIPYMEKSRYEPGISYLLQELKIMLSKPNCGKITDRALLLDSTALYEDTFHNKTEKAIKIEKDAHGAISFPKSQQKMLTLHRIFMQILADCISA